MSATLLSDLPQIVCDEIKALMPELSECKPQPGKYDLRELKKSGIRAPAVLVSLLGFKPEQNMAIGRTFTLNMAAYIVTRDKLGLNRDVFALNITQALAQLMPGNDWGLEHLGEAANVQGHPLITSASRDAAVSLWAVTWDQPITFFAKAPGPLGVELYLGEAPEIGAAYEGSYERIGEDAS